MGRIIPWLWKNKPNVPKRQPAIHSSGKLSFRRWFTMIYHDLPWFTMIYLWKKSWFTIKNSGFFITLWGPKACNAKKPPQCSWSFPRSSRSPRPWTSAARDQVTVQSLQKNGGQSLVVNLWPCFFGCLDLFMWLFWIWCFTIISQN